jgi:hypothetical protein
MPTEASGSPSQARKDVWRLYFNTKTNNGAKVCCTRLMGGWVSGPWNAGLLSCFVARLASAPWPGGRRGRARRLGRRNSRGCSNVARSGEDEALGSHQAA